MKNLLIRDQGSLILFIKRFLLSIALILATRYSDAQVHANFAATPNSGCAPLVVDFSDFSSGNPTSWKWDLGNGTTSLLQNPSVTYFNPGKYNITLIAKNSQGEDSAVKSGFIEVYSAPQVNFSGTPRAGCFPLPAQFTDRSVAGSGVIFGWEWDFGDGELSTDQNPKHTYLASGNYNVSLRVSNNFGCISSITNPQFIQISSGVTAEFSNSVPSTCNQPATIQFSNSSTGTGALSYQWKFGDGAESSVANPSHNYNVGNYVVTLIVANSSGCSDTIVKPNAVIIGNVKADFSVPAIVCQGTNINFVNASNPAPSAAVWTFGDGSTSSVINPIKAYSNAGNYIVKMVASFGTCKDSISKPLLVTTLPAVDFIAASTNSCKAPFTVNFKNVTAAATSFSWDFGDGNLSNLPNPTHTYLKEGFYSVTLTVTNAAGCTNNVEKKDFIKIKAPTASLNNLPQKGCAPFSHSFPATISSVDSIASYLWNFGDGATSALSNPTHVYTTPGIYDVALSYTTVSGCTFSVSVISGIFVGSKPTAKFTANPLDVCASTAVNFENESSANANEWLWQFGDGASSILQNPNHQYVDTGYFSVTLISNNNGCPDTLLVPNYVHVKAPIAKFRYAVTCAAPGHVVFTDNSIGADTWSWTFGDGSTSSMQNPVHDYATSGVYGIQLIVTNKTTGCDYTKIDTMTVLKEFADYNSSVTTVCKNIPVIFNAINSNQQNINSYTWLFGDGVTTSASTPSITHNYTVSGSFNVTMILTLKNGCKDSIVKPLAIVVDGPSAAFKSSRPGECLDNAISFIDSSYANGSSPVQQWQWNWGDGSTQNLSGPNFQHVYNTPGIYSVSLKVTDRNGCTDSIRNANIITISKPVAAFKSDTLSCSLNGVAFTNLSTGPSLTYQWNFGDGTTSVQANPVHTYNTEGTYSVGLSITDQFGCSDFISKTNYIRIANPKADFLVSDTIGRCPPLVVNFTNTSKNYISWNWDFGDGTTSSLQSPSHFYSSPGTFNAILIITGPGGCTDSKSVRIKVNGPVGSFTYKNISGCKPLQTNFKATTGKNTTFVWDFNDGTTSVTPDSIVSHTFQTAGFYLPRMILSDTTGCKIPITGFDSIKVFGVVASFTNPGKPLCDSGLVSFTNTSQSNDAFASFSWNFGDNTSSTLENPIHNYNATGFYNSKLFIVTKNGCKDSVSIPSSVKVVNGPVISIGGNSGACTPALLTFTGLINRQDTSSLTWKWDFANGNVSTLQNPLAQTFATAGSYSVNAIATNSSGCSDTAIKMVQAYPIPNLQATNDTAICKGKTLALKANDAQSYSWSPASFLSCTNCATPVSNTDTSIRYFVTGKSNMGCIAKDSVYIDVKFPNTVKVGGPDTLCLGSSIQLKAIGAEVYNWTPALGLNDPNIASPVASPGNTIIYKVTGTDTKKCFTSSANIQVKVYPLPVVSAGEDQTINVGRSFEIIPKISADVSAVVWTPATGIISRDYPAITVKPVESTEYTIEVKNDGGCRARDKISIYVLCGNANVFVPNTFSPNGDGVNDIFYPRGSGVFAVKSLRIFSRWGEVVFEKANFNANDASSGWDGTFKGKKLSPDVFVYALEVVCSNNQSLVFKGNVALIR